MKHSFSKLQSSPYCFMDALHRCYLNIWRKSLTSTTQRCCKQYWTRPGGSIPQSSSCTTSYHPSWKLSKLDEPDMWNTAWEVGANSYSWGPLHTDEQRQDDQLEPTYNSSVLIQVVDLETSWEWWTIKKSGGEGQEDPHCWYDMKKKQHLNNFKD